MTNRRALVSVALVMILVALPVYLLRLNGAAGMMVDDAWYVLLAKSLADGSGYKLISSPAVAILPLYPPGFPALLSLMFRASPDFPQNVPLLKSVSIAAMMGVGVLTFLYLRVHRQQPPALAGGMAVATALVPAFVFLATSTLMSECVFTLTQLAAVVLVHRSLESSDSRRGILLAIAAAAVTAAAVLIRSAAAGLILAVMLWLIKEGRWKRAALFAAGVVFCLLPWLTYTRTHAPTTEQRVQHGGAVVYSYGEQFWMRWAGAPAAGRVTATDIPARIATNLTDVFARGAGGIFVPAFLRGPSESGEEVIGLGPGSMGDNAAMMAISLLLSAIVLAGFIATAKRQMTVAEFLVPVSVAIVLVWPFWSFRFLVPLTPFVFLYFVAGVHLLTRSIQVVRITLLCLIVFYGYDHAGYLFLARSHSGSGVEWIDRAESVDAALDWIRHNLRDDGPIAATNSALLYMRTGRKSLAYDNPMVQLDSWKARGFRYVICLHPLEMPTGAFKVLYQSPARFWVIEL
ncbi:MAG: hypothetical protein ACRD1W_14270 [Vicinamibacterales bacterium]